ncbi:S8 family peptidase [Streptomyces hirsutus]|uniref:S8 family peptidase n=1 Tax=Streptomyces hirsutus TaxID=35620 RepID=UPI0014706AEC|nr:S8 family peptidase [Streptomyces hirsutus]
MDRSSDRPGHSNRLSTNVEDVQSEAVNARRSLDPRDRADGFAVRVEAAPEHELKLESLDKSGLTLMSVHEADEERPQEAVVWVPDGSVPTLLRKIDQFTENTRSGTPKNAALVANIEQIEQATVESLWQEQEPLPDHDAVVWWELWLDPALSEADPVETLRRLSRVHGWQMVPRTVGIGHFRVAQLRTSVRGLTQILRTNACPSEIRKPTFTEEFHSRELRDLHRDFVVDLVNRLRPAALGAPAVTLFDTGVDQEHPLLRPVLIGAHSVMSGEGPDDNDPRGHGTRMTGLTAFGDLEGALSSAALVQLDHHVESVKILPRRAPDTPRPFGEVTATAVATAEAADPEQPRTRVFAMAVTAESGRGINGTDGTATLWSAAVDALAAGTDVTVTHDRIDLLGPPEPGQSRLIVVSAGNVRDHQPSDLVDSTGNATYLDLCDTSRIEEPAQAWNALTVGAHTEFDHVPTADDYAGYRTVATPGSLSPHSRTSVLFRDAAALKPDIVMEGGNLLIDADVTQVTNHDAVSLTTTARSHLGQLLTTIDATSAATAQAARLAALAHAHYPNLRAETVRGLLVHEAQWTNAMIDGVYNRNGRRKIGAGQLARTVLRRYGWGVPTQERVLSSTASAVTMIIQGSLKPFVRDGAAVRLGELKMHELPWPREQLLDLDAAEVQLRVTLSYFIEPNPGRRGMLGQHTYASHRLRFALKGPFETMKEFEGRTAQAAQAEDDARTTVRPFDADRNWVVGPTNRDRGCLHADLWRGTARELADCGVLAVFPAGGWWKYHNSADRVGRPVTYGLLVSLTTPEVTADLYTPTAIQLGIPVPAEISTASETAVSIDSRLF